MTTQGGDPGEPNLLPLEPRMCLDRVGPLRDMSAAEGFAGTREQSALINIYGESGLGKTTLALHFAYRRWLEYPCALYYDLRGSGAGVPADPAEVLAHWARMLGLPSEQITGDVYQLAGAVRNATRRRRVLILLDDAFTAAQIQHLLPSSPRSLVIVTSRRRIVGRDVPDFVDVRLEPFTEEVAVELLGQLLGPETLAAEPEAVRELIELCGRMPLTLKVAAARIGDWRRAFPVAGFVGRVRSSEALAELTIDDDRLVEAIYDVCYRELAPARARAYRLLALHPGPRFGTAAAAAMLGEPEDRAADLLAELERLDLVELVGTDRYRFHHLTGEHARRCAFTDADEQARRSAVAAAVTHYRRFAVSRIKSMSRRPLDGPLAAETAAAYHGAGADARAAAELEIEHDNLRAAVAAAEDLGLDDECVQLCFALRPWLYDTDRAAELTEIAMIGSRAAERGGDPAARMHMLGVVAIAAEKQGEHLTAADYALAIKALHEARRLAAELAEPRVLASTFEWEGLLAEQRGDLGAALVGLEQAMATVEQKLTGDLRQRTAALLNMHIGRITLRLATAQSPSDATAVQAAIVHLELAERYFASHETWVNTARINHLLGAAMLETGRGDEAERRLVSAAAAFDRENFASQAVKVLSLLADVRLHVGDRQGARAALRSAVEPARRLGRADLEADLNRRIAELGE